MFVETVLRCPTPHCIQKGKTHVKKARECATHLPMSALFPRTRTSIKQQRAQDDAKTQEHADQHQRECDGRIPEQVPPGIDLHHHRRR
jgi:hypothetical protein